jgi:serine/threonine protein kinase
VISREYVSDGQNYSPVLLDSLVKANILIDQTGHARLADFGLLTIMKDPTNLLTSSSYTQGGTARWMSPELIAPQRFGLKSSRPTQSSDCYALGMVVYETISGNLPFHEDTDLTVFVKVLEGERPLRGAGFRNDLWRMLERCWKSRPSDRPTIEDVLRCLEMFSKLSERPSPEADEGMERDGVDWDSTNGSSGVSSGTSDASTTTSFNSSYVIDRSPSPTPLSIPRVDSDGEGTYQVSPIGSHTYLTPRMTRHVGPVHGFRRDWSTRKI